MRIPHFSRIVAALLARAVAPAHAQLNISWITQYGTSPTEKGNTITVDASGQSWVSGFTSGALGGSSAGGYDVFVAKVTGVPEPSAALRLTFGAGLLLRRRA